MICDKGISNFYLYHWLLENMDTIVANANGTTFLEISKSNFRPISVLKPSQEVLNVFTEKVTPLFLKIKNNSIQNKLMVDLRDRLLPGLISGDIQIN